jgi:aryl-alcohol dehydrogenase-like predicted oxidoreductase
VHWPDPGVPIEETAAAMADLQRAGKIRVIGVSNFSPAQIEAFRKVAPVQTVQSPYNLFERAIEGVSSLTVEIITLSRSPMGRCAGVSFPAA